MEIIYIYSIIIYYSMSKCNNNKSVQYNVCKIAVNKCFDKQISVFVTNII